MINLDAHAIRRSLSAQLTSRLDEFEILPTIDSTNSYLLQQPSPKAQRFRVAIADHQTAGRGRHNKNWQSPPGSGLCLSLAYTYAAMPESLPALTLALGVGVINALSGSGVECVSLKWPNDIVALDRKLGGMLVEVQSGSVTGVTVVVGIGLNVDLSGQIDFGTNQTWAQCAVDMKSVRSNPPQRNILAAALIEHFIATLLRFEIQGFGGFVDEWREYDWLFGKVVTVEMPDGQLTGVAAGVDIDGALLVDTGRGQRRVISGSIVMASLAGLQA